MVSVCITLILIVFAYGCAIVISKDVKKQVAREINFKQVNKDPEAYKGEVKGKRSYLWVR